MILVTGTARVRRDRLDGMRDAAAEMIAASRQEEGCRAYRYAFDLDDPAVVHFHEEWASAEALAEHFRTPHLRRFSATLEDLLVGPPTITTWTAEQVDLL